MPQALPRPCEARFDGADCHAKRSGDLLVGQAVDFPEHNHRALFERQCVQGAPHLPGGFLLLQHPIRHRRLPSLRQLALRRVIQAHLLRAMPPPPPALPVRRLIDGDPINPGPQRRLTAELGQHAEHAEEDLLTEVKSFLRIAKQVQSELVDHALMVGHQPRARILVSARALLYERPVCARGIRPRQCA